MCVCVWVCVCVRVFFPRGFDNGSGDAQGGSEKGSRVPRIVPGKHGGNSEFWGCLLLYIFRKSLIELFWRYSPKCKSPERVELT